MNGRPPSVRDFHCCATCVHYRVGPAGEGQAQDAARQPICTKDGRNYVTRKDWKFNCWTPKAQVRALMDKQRLEARGQDLGGSEQPT